MSDTIDTAGLREGDAGSLLRPPGLTPTERARLERVLPTVRLLQEEFRGRPHPRKERPAASRYTFRRLHAMGGIGEVWLARDSVFERDIALKELRPDRTALPGLHERLLQEARVTARLQHPGIVPVYELVEDPAQGDPFFTMRFVRGRTLTEAARALHARPAGDRRVELLNLLSAFVSACQTVAYAHSSGVIHRDLKPENVLLGDYGEVLVIDWGFAKVRGDVEDPGPNGPAEPTGVNGRAGETLAGVAVGTPAYMAPEQAIGDRDRTDERADIYGLGAILYEILSGRPPYVGESAADILRQVREKPAAFPEAVAVPPGLAAVCRRAMARDPDGRYPTADALARDVQRWLADEPPTAYREPPLARLGRFARRHRTAVAAAVTLALAAAAGTTALGVAETRAARAMAEADAVARDELGREQALTAREKTRAGEERVQAEWQRYLHLIGRAERDLRAANLGRCALLLDQCPPTCRGWEWYCLQRLRRSEPILLRGHTDGIRTLAFRPGQHQLATAGYEKTVKVWDVNTGSERFSLDAGTGTIGSVAYSPDGKWLAAGGWNGRVAVWDADDGKPLFSVRHPDRVERVRFSPDGRRLVAVGSRKLAVWDTASGRPCPLPAPKLSVETVVFAPDSRLLQLTATGPGGEVVLRDGDTGRAVGTVDGARRFFRAEAVSPDGSYLVSSTADAFYGGGTDVVLSDAATGRPVRRLVGHSDPAFGLAFSPDGKRVASAGYDQTVRVWDPLTGEETLTLWGHTDSVRAVEFSTDGRFLASGGDDKVVRVWDTAPLPLAAPRYEQHTFAGHGRRVVGVVALPTSAAAFASVGEDDTVRFWDADRGTETKSFRLKPSGSTCLAVSPDGRWLGTAMAIRGYWLDAQTGRVHELPYIEGYGQVMAVAFDRDGKRLLTGGWDGTARVWDLATKKLVTALTGHGHRTAGVTYDPVRGHMTTAGGDGLVRIWDATSGRELASLPGPGGGCRAVAYSPDGRWLAASGGDGAIAVWDAASRDRRAVLRGHASAVNGLAFRRDGAVLASAGSDWTVKLWRVAGPDQPHELQTLRGHTDRVNGVAFSTDGRKLASAGSDGNVKVWDVTGLDPEAR